MSKDFGLWNEIEAGYPKFEKGIKHYRLHWQKCLFLAGNSQEEAYAKVKKYVDIELPEIALIEGYENTIDSPNVSISNQEETIDNNEEGS